MIPIPSRGAIIAILVAAMVSYVWWIHYDRNKIQTEFNEYRRILDDQISQNKAEAAATEKRQNEKYKVAQTAYEVDSRKLTSTIKRLRDIAAVSGSGTLPVAGGSSVPMLEAPTDTSRATPAVEIGDRACEGTQFWEDALKDTLQCRALIDFVNPK